MKKFYGISLLLLSLSMVGCNNDSSNIISEDISKDTIISSEYQNQSEDNNIEKTEERTVVPTNTQESFFKVNNIKTEPIDPLDGYRLPFFPYIKDADGNYVENPQGSKVEPYNDAHIFSTTITKREDEDKPDYYKYTFQYRISTDIKFYDMGDDPDYSFIYSKVSIVDSYTGKLFSLNSTQSGVPTDFLTQINWKGKLCDIPYTVEKNTNYGGYNNLLEKGNYNNVSVEFYTIYYTYTIYVPKDYDGLVFAINKEGITSYSKKSSNSSDSNYINLESSTGKTYNNYNEKYIFLTP